MWHLGYLLWHYLALLLIVALFSSPDPLTELGSNMLLHASLAEKKTLPCEWINLFSTSNLFFLPEQLCSTELQCLCVHKPLQLELNVQYVIPGVSSWSDSLAQQVPTARWRIRTKIRLLLKNRFQSFDWNFCRYHISF